MIEPSAAGVTLRHAPFITIGDPETLFLPKVRRDKLDLTRERAQSFLTDEHLQRVVLAYQDFQDEPGFTRVAPIEEIRAKEGNLSIPLYVGGETQAQTDAAAETATTALPEALIGWLQSSVAVRQSLQALLSTK